MYHHWSSSGSNTVTYSRSFTLITGGSEDITKAINAEYDQLFKVLKDRHESKSASDSGNQNAKQSDYNRNMYDWENDKALREVLQKIIRFDGIEIEIAGQWIWMSGNT